MAIPSSDAHSADRRVRRSRRALHTALVSLSLERGYDGLTVDDLTKHADMARRTFYAHYTDKDALLRAVVTELLEDLVARLRAVAPADLRDAEGVAIREMFSHGQEHTATYRMVLAGAANGSGLRMLANTLSSAVSDTYTEHCGRLGIKPRVPLDFLSRAFVGQHLTLLRWWLDNPGTYTLEQMASMRLDLLVHGEVWALGFGEDTVPFRHTDGSPMTTHD